MYNKNRIKLLITLAIILIIGLILVINNLRPVSERKMKGRERLDTKKELQKINKQITALSDSIGKFPDKVYLFYKRAGLYRSINKYGKAIEDYTVFINTTKDIDLKAKAEIELKSVKKVKIFLDKQNN